MDKQLYSANDPSTLSTNMVNFGRVTPEIEVTEMCTFETIRQKAAISPNISTTTEPIWIKCPRKFSCQAWRVCLRRGRDSEVRRRVVFPLFL